MSEQKIIHLLKIVSILAGVILMILAMLFMDKSSNDSENAGFIISGAILFSAGLISLSMTRK